MVESNDEISLVKRNRTLFLTDNRTNALSRLTGHVITLGTLRKLCRNFAEEFQHEISRISASFGLKRYVFFSLTLSEMLSS